MASQPTNPLMLRLDRYDETEAFAFNLNHPPTTPSEWFSKMFPTATMNYGTPCLERCYVSDGFTCTDIETINDNFFAAVLGGDERLNHKTVYYTPESTFYFRDVDGCFHPTDETKLSILLSSLLVRCAEEMPATVNRRSLFTIANDTNHLKGIVKKARSILAADSTFFSVDSANQRVEGPETVERTALAFVGASTTASDATLTLKQVMDAFAVYCEQNGVELVKRPLIKQTLIEAGNNHHGVRLRHDIINATGKQTNGWKGLTLTQRLGLGSMIGTDKPDHPVDPANAISHKTIMPGLIFNNAE